MGGLAASEPGASIHASCVVVGEAGILIRGPSGAGKSTLARLLIDLGSSFGRFAALVGDDRILLSAAAGRVVARPHPALSGQLEMRGFGIVPVPFEPAAVVRLVVDCLAEMPSRLPESGVAHLCGVALPTFAVPGGSVDTAWAVLRLLRGADDTSVTVPRP